jgi:hypothetical protein
MTGMKDLSDDFKLSFRSTGEINEAFSGLVARTAKDPGIRYRGKKPPRAAIINALVMWVTSLPRSEQRAIVAQGMELLNDHLDSDDEAPVEAPAPAPEVKADPPAKRRRGTA